MNIQFFFDHAAYDIRYLLTLVHLLINSLYFVKILLLNQNKLQNNF